MDIGGDNSIFSDWTHSVFPRARRPVESWLPRSERPSPSRIRNIPVFQFGDTALLGFAKFGSSTRSKRQITAGICVMYVTAD
jgi:hypothetical protein